MVKLNRIYTGTGDDGTTGLADGTRVPKSHARIEAYGTVDELNALLGMGIRACAHSQMREVRALLERVQNDLFDLGADLATPGQDEGLRVVASQVEALEKAIDRFNDELGPLDSFVLPGGGQAPAWLHFARTVCRRAERHVVALAEEHEINPEALRYLNRLSDLLFVLARWTNDAGEGDVQWIPGKNRE